MFTGDFVLQLKLIAAASVSVLLLACGSNESPAGGGVGLVLVSLPATVEGELAADVAEGPTNDEGYSEINFGTLTVDGRDIGVQVSGSVLQSVGLHDGIGKVRATLTSKTDQYGQTVYTIASLQRP